MRTLITVLLGVLLVGVAWHEDASASTTSTHTRAVSGNTCTYVGQTSGYYHSGDPIVIDPYTPNTYREFRCSHDGMRIYKSFASTRAEFLDLKMFASENDHARYRMAFCPVTRDKAYIVDLAYFYYASMTTILPAEKQHYVRWLDRYSERRGCRVY